MKLLSLDLSSKSSGWAVFEDTKLIDSGCITSASTDVIKRIFIMRDGIKDIINKYDIKTIVLEEVRPDFQNAHTYKILTWVQAAIIFMAYEIDKKIDISYIQASSWRSTIGIQTGRGIKRGSLKQKDIEYVKEHYNKTVNDDEADAICIGAAAIKKNNEEINWE